MASSLASWGPPGCEAGDGNLGPMEKWWPEGSGMSGWCRPQLRVKTEERVREIGVQMSPQGTGRWVANCTWNRQGVPGGPHGGLGPFVCGLSAWPVGQACCAVETLGKLRTQGERRRAKAGLGVLPSSCGLALAPCWHPSSVWGQSFSTIVPNGLQA